MKEFTEQLLCILGAAEQRTMTFTFNSDFLHPLCFHRILQGCMGLPGCGFVQLVQVMLKEPVSQ